MLLWDTRDDLVFIEVCMFPQASGIIHNRNTNHLHTKGINSNTIIIHLLLLLTHPLIKIRCPISRTNSSINRHPDLIYLPIRRYKRILITHSCDKYFNK